MAWIWGTAAGVGTAQSVPNPWRWVVPVSLVWLAVVGALAEVAPRFPRRRLWVLGSGVIVLVSAAVATGMLLRLLPAGRRPYGELWFFWTAANYAGGWLVRSGKWRSLGLGLALAAMLICLNRTINEVSGPSNILRNDWPFGPAAFLALACLTCNLAAAVRWGLVPVIWRLLAGPNLAGALPIADTNAAPGVSKPVQVALACGALALALLVLAAMYFNKVRNDAKTEVEHHLQQVLALKVDVAGNWLEERLADARMMMQEPHVTEAIRRLAGAPVAARREGRLKFVFENFLKTNSCSLFRLYGPDGEFLTENPLPPPSLQISLSKEELGRWRRATNAELISPAADANQAEEVQFAGPVHDGTGKFWGMIRLTVPVTNGLAQQVLTLRHARKSEHILLSTTTNGNFRPYINAASAPPAGGFTNLHDNPQSLVMDYDPQNNRVVGLTLSVPGTPWFLAAVIGIEDAFAPVRRTAWALFAGWALVLATMGLSLGMGLRHRQYEGRLRELATERSRQELSQRLTFIVEAAHDAILLFGEDLRVVEANDQAAVMYGQPIAELLQRSLHDLRVPEPGADTPQQFHEKLRGAGGLFERTHRRADGSCFPVEVSLRPVMLAGRPHVFAMVRDISQRRAHEAEIRRLNQLYQVRIRIGQALVQSTNPAQVFEAVCRTLVDVGDFKLAWLGVPDTERAYITILARAGDHAGYAAGLRLPLRGDSPAARGPSARAINEGRKYVSNDFQNDPELSPWHEAAQRTGIASGFVMPLRQEGQVAGVLTVYAGQKDYFRPREIDLLEETGGDISFALDVFARDDRRKQAEAALRVSRDRLANAERLAHLGNWEIDWQHRQVRVSDEVYRIFELPPQAEWPDLDSFLSRIRSPEVAMVAPPNPAAEGPFAYEYRLRLPDGRRKHLHAVGETIRDASGGRRSVGTVQNISDLKEAELHLDRSIRQLQALYAVTEAVNEKNLALPEVLTVTAQTLGLALPPGARLRVQVGEEWADFGPPTEAGDSLTVVIRINELPAGRLSAHLPAGAGPEGGRQVFTDEDRKSVNRVALALGVSLGARASLIELKESSASLEKRVTARTAELGARTAELQALMGAIPDLVLLMDRGGKVLTCKPSAETGATRADHWRGEGDWHDFLQSQAHLLSPCRELGGRALAERTPVGMEFSPADGVWLELRANAAAADSFVVFVRDISARKRLEAHTAEVLEQKRRLLEAKTRFIDTTSHEFRTPLSTIMGSVDLLGGHFARLTEAKRGEIMHRIHQALTRLTKMLDELILINRAESGRLPLNIQTFDARRVVVDSVEESRLSDGAEHRWLPPGGSDPVPLQTDPEHLRTILVNLLGNAARYSPRDGLIRVTLTESEDHLEVAVADQGIGVPAADRARIFEPFERGSNVGTRKGTGLGLDIVKRLSHLMGGDARYEPVPTGGSCFIVRLPRKFRSAPEPATTD